MHTRWSFECCRGPYATMPWSLLQVVQVYRPKTIALQTPNTTYSKGSMLTARHHPRALSAFTFTIPPVHCRADGREHDMRTADHCMHLCSGSGLISSGHTARKTNSFCRLCTSTFRRTHMSIGLLDRVENHIKTTTVSAEWSGLLMAGPSAHRLRGPEQIGAR